MELAAASGMRIDRLVVISLHAVGPNHLAVAATISAIGINTAVVIFNDESTGELVTVDESHRLVKMALVLGAVAEEAPDMRHARRGILPPFVLDAMGHAGG